ncbi:MAG: hypothetical protein U1F70_01950 [Candidatus Competibacteraceae bacterium]
MAISFQSAVLPVMIRNDFLVRLLVFQIHTAISPLIIARQQQIAGGAEFLVLSVQCLDLLKYRFSKSQKDATSNAAASTP